MKPDQRHQTFFDLHQSGCFVIPNPWDIGSARVMAAKGAKALATTSSGFAFRLGRPDMGHVSRDEALCHAQEIIGATDLPVSGDFENGFGDGPDDVSQTIRLAGEVGLSGCSIEDTQMSDGNPAYDFELAVERIKAGADAAKELARPFVFCARADGVMNGTYDMAEALKRVEAFAKAGADLIYVPMVPDLSSLGQVVQASDKPVNALAAGALLDAKPTQLAQIGVRRISVGGMIARITHGVICKAMDDVVGNDNFDALRGAMAGSQVDPLLLEGAGKG